MPRPTRCWPSSASSRRRTGATGLQLILFGPKIRNTRTFFGGHAWAQCWMLGVGSRVHLPIRIFVHPVHELIDPSSPYLHELPPDVPTLLPVLPAACPSVQLSARTASTCQSVCPFAGAGPRTLQCIRVCEWYFGSCIYLSASLFAYLSVCLPHSALWFVVHHGVQGVLGRHAPLSVCLPVCLSVYLFFRLSWRRDPLAGRARATRVACAAS
jgi:hypothetical protein